LMIPVMALGWGHRQLPASPEFDKLSQN
jgi:hypothetical protein